MSSRVLASLQIVILLFVQLFAQPAQAGLRWKLGREKHARPARLTGPFRIFRSQPPRVDPLGVSGSKEGSSAALPQIDGSSSQERAMADPAASYRPERSSVQELARVEDKDAPAARALVFLALQGRAVQESTWDGLIRRISQEPELARELSGKARVRLVLAGNNPRAGALSEADKPELAQALAASGIAIPIEVEKVPIDWSKPERGGRDSGQAALSAKASRARFTIASLIAEPAFLARTFWVSVTRPTLSEILGGIATKAVPFVISVGVWTHDIGTGKPLALAAAIGLSFALDTFHGIWINTWNNFQHNVYKLRGSDYQFLFNWGYGQLWNVTFRSIIWSSKPGIIAPWAFAYWGDVIKSSVPGTVFGTLGYRGLNNLYGHGRIKRWQRSALQQLRDIFFLVSSTFFMAGSMGRFWAVFWAQQSIDFAIYVLSVILKKRDILYVVDPEIARTPEFKALYPFDQHLEPAWRQALEEVLKNPMIWPLVRAYQWLRGGSPGSNPHV
ncbi:MAG: hypothetical protein HY549_03755 [Elusimicrobia bacterium]|nr:hypothetical protein [Elusimicrobiota bacterium]